jgi:tRNA splicing endonuclease
MAGDDDGFVSSTTKIFKELDLDERCLEELLLADSVYQFDSKIVLIMDWKVHNQIAPSKRQETLYQTEYGYLKQSKKKRYVIMSEKEMCSQENLEVNNDGASSLKIEDKIEKAKRFEAQLAEQKKYKNIISSV